MQSNMNLTNRGIRLARNQAGWRIEVKPEFQEEIARIFPERAPRSQRMEFLLHPLGEIEQLVAPTRLKFDRRCRTDLCESPANSESAFAGSSVCDNGPKHDAFQEERTTKRGTLGDNRVTRRVWT
jgi:hypothetical protein